MANDHVHSIQEQLIEVKLSPMNKDSEKKLKTLIQANSLTVSKMAIADVTKLSKEGRILRFLEQLKQKSKDMISRPIKSIHSFELFHGVKLPPDLLIFQEVRDENYDGFFTCSDIVSKRRRKTQNLSSEVLREKERKYEKTAKGQVAPFPSKWSWKFSWSDIEHKNLKSILFGPQHKVEGDSLHHQQRRELLEHLVAEMFIYFRRGIPSVYLDLMMRTLISDFPALRDGKSPTGYAFLRPQVINAFRTLCRKNELKELSKRKSCKSNGNLLMLSDREIYIRVVANKCENFNQLHDLLSLCPSSEPFQPPIMRLTMYVSKLVSFFNFFKSNRKTVFAHDYPELAFERMEFDVNDEPFNRENVAIHMIHNHCRTSKLLVPFGEHGIGIYFRMDEDLNLSALAFGATVRGCVMVDRRELLPDLDIASGVYSICAINCILNLEYLTEHEDFLVYVEKEFMGISRSSHTSLTSGLRKAVSRYPKTKKVRSCDQMNIDDVPTAELG